MTDLTRMLTTLLVLAMGASPARALEVVDAWIRATVPGQAVGAAYMTLKSPSRARLIAVRSSACKRVEIHSANMDDGTMQMRQLKSLELPAGKAVALAPMGTHLMLMELAAPLKEGERIALELVVEERGRRKTIPVTADVRPLIQ